MELTEPLAPVLEADHQIIPFQAKTAPVLNDAQPFSGPIEIGIDQPCHTLINRRLASHQIRGTLWELANARIMQNGGSESTMHVLVWGIVLLGSIGVFIVWGLANAYPTPA